MFNVYVIENCNMLMVQNLRTLMFTMSWIVTNILDLMNPCESMMNLSLSLSPNPFTICYHLFNHVQNWHTMFLAFETSFFFPSLKGTAGCLLGVQASKEQGVCFGEASMDMASSPFGKHLVGLAKLLVKSI
jgi:hypothetical protein